MSKNPLARFNRSALWYVPVVLVPVAFFASLPWLKDQSSAVSLGFAAAAASFVMGYSLFLEARVNRSLDEVEIAGKRFAQTKGMTIGSFAFVLVLVFPPTLNALADLANTIAAGSPDKAVKVGIAFGFMAVVLLQALAILAVSIWWERRIRAPE